MVGSQYIVRENQRGFGQLGGRAEVEVKFGQLRVAFYQRLGLGSECSGNAQYLVDFPGLGGVTIVTQ